MSFTYSDALRDPTGSSLQALAVVLEKPGQLTTRALRLDSPGEDDVVVDLDWTGVSAGTERLLFRGEMPPFPGMGYPLVPGYEGVGRVTGAGGRSGHRVGATVFVPGARCFGEIHGLFGGAASRVVVPGVRARSVPSGLGERTTLLALAATAHHALAARGARPPSLIVGHGALGRLLARLTVLRGAPPPVVWETEPRRRQGEFGYPTVDPESDPRRDYDSVYDASGDGSLIDALISRLAHGGELVLAGFYSRPLSFAFPPAFMREARIRIAAEWSQPDLEAVVEYVESGRLDLDGLITHRMRAEHASEAYEIAFDDPNCLKMILDWRPPR